MEKVSYKLLKELYRKDELDIKAVNEITGVKKEGQPNPYAINLSKSHLADSFPVGGKVDGEGGFVDGVEHWRITLEGRDYIERHRKELLTFWLPYAITTLIAIAALLK